ncbi:DUF1552 domain-containing protein [Haloferula sp.]|uniref:DUF1552 domain-containing protein n=1 Tax=Haloferula sp. TaxID=2497595 RepID=UPI00329AE075
MNPKTNGYSRRAFLRGAGALLSLPFLETFGAVPGKIASGKVAPTRFLTVFHPNGVYPKAWDAAFKGGKFALADSPILAPLAKLSNDITAISGMSNLGAKGHVQMTASFLTGTGLRGGKNSISLDQMIAKKHGGSTLFPSLELGTEPPRGGAVASNPIALANTISWNTESSRLSPEINPRVAFDRLFRDTGSLAAKREAQLKRSVIDLVLDDAKSMQRKVSSLDKHKIDEYLDSMRAVEVQVEKTLDPPEREWEPIDEPDLRRPPAGIPRERDAHLRLMMDIMLMALWTDTTRVGTLMAAHGFSRQNFSFIDGVRSDHHGMSHHKEKKSQVDQYILVSRWYASQFAYLLERMKSVDEGNGSLLDNTAVLYGSGMKDGNGHIKDNLPILLAGKGGGTLTPGRHIACKKGTPFANLHQSIAGKFGIYEQTESFNGVGTGLIKI